nr:hypothetical protein [Methylosinus sp. Sm6]
MVASKDGEIVLETAVPTDPGVIAAALEPYLPRLERIGHEVGSVAPWLHCELAALGLCPWCFWNADRRPPL